LFQLLLSCGNELKASLHLGKWHGGTNSSRIWFANTL
jgi:hypothetical protein